MFITYHTHNPSWKSRRKIATLNRLSHSRYYYLFFFFFHVLIRNHLTLSVFFLCIAFPIVTYVVFVSIFIQLSEFVQKLCICFADHNFLFSINNQKIVVYQLLNLFAMLRRQVFERKFFAFRRTFALEHFIISQSGINLT